MSAHRMRMTGLRRLVGAGLVAVAMSGLTGCFYQHEASPPPSTHGPVRLGDNPGVICLSESTTRTLTMGFDTIRNRANAPVTVSDVALRGSRGLTVAEAYLMPVHHDMLVGVTNKWPPANPARETSGDWDKRVRAIGAGRLNPHSGAHTWNLVLKLTVAPGVGRPKYDAVSVQYISAGIRYEARNDTALVVKTQC